MLKTDRITIGITAPVDAGKTTLSEALLYHAGSIRQAGRVDHQNAFLDTHSLEKQRGITIFSKQNLLLWMSSPKTDGQELITALYSTAETAVMPESQNAPNAL